MRGRKNGEGKKRTSPCHDLVCFCTVHCAYMRWHFTRIIKFCAIYIENVNSLLKRFVYFVLAHSLSHSDPLTAANTAPNCIFFLLEIFYVNRTLLEIYTRTHKRNQATELNRMCDIFCFFVFR